MSAVWGHGQLVVDEPASTADVRALDVDETTFAHAGPRLHHLARQPAARTRGGAPSLAA